MTDSELLSYIKRANDLELALYTQTKISDMYSKMRAGNAPKPPHAEIPEEPSLPANGSVSQSISESYKIRFVTFIVFGALFAILAVIFIVADDTFWSFLGAAISAIMFYLAYSTHKDYVQIKLRIEAANKDYEQKIKQYQIAKKEYDATKQKIARDYEQAFQQYHTTVLQYNAETQRIIASMKEIETQLSQSLQHHYENNVIFPKYRNLVAVSMLYEYISSGRCSSLSGPNGAYNLYESELRHDIIISQLMTITDNLEQIKQNQFVLYDGFQSANRTINDILSELIHTNESVKLSAYYSYVTALIETSPRISVGTIF